MSFEYGKYDEYFPSTVLDAPPILQGDLTNADKHTSRQ